MTIVDSNNLIDAYYAPNGTYNDEVEEDDDSVVFFMETQE